MDWCFWFHSQIPKIGIVLPTGSEWWNLSASCRCHALIHHPYLAPKLSDWLFFGGTKHRTIVLVRSLSGHFGLLWVEFGQTWAHFSLYDHTWADSSLNESTRVYTNPQELMQAHLSLPRPTPNYTKLLWAWRGLQRHSRAYNRSYKSLRELTRSTIIHMTLC